MKQHITYEQMCELSPQARVKLTKWFWNKIVSGPLPELVTRDEEDVTIGQMIEFLDEHWGAWQISSWQEWSITRHENGETQYHNTEPELCDALWEAVKDILER